MKPYIPQSLPLADLDWESLLPLIGPANRAVAGFGGMLNSMVNPAVLLSPLLTQEAVLSSQIEGSQATMQEVLEFQADPKKKTEPAKQSDIKETLNYRKAISQAVDSLKKRPLCLNMIRDLHMILLDSVRGKNLAPGEFRRIQNYIGPPGCSLEEASFIPPSPEMVLPALDNWEKYIHTDEKDILVQLAVIKAQFEMIHPFLDGNGRVGRMLVPVFLFAKGILNQPMFYISAYFEADRETYYFKLQEISRQGDWNGWISYFLEAVRIQANDNLQKAQDIFTLYNNIKQEVPGLIKSHYTIQAIDALFELPIFSSSWFAASTGIPRESAYRILKALHHGGIITEIKPGRGSSPAIFTFPQLLEATG